MSGTIKHTISLSEEAMLGFLGHGHPHSAAWFMELTDVFEQATGVKVRANPDQAIRLTYEEARERLREQAAEYRREAQEQDGEGRTKLLTAAEVVDCVSRIAFGESKGTRS